MGFNLANGWQDMSRSAAQASRILLHISVVALCLIYYQAHGMAVVRSAPSQSA